VKKKSPKKSSANDKPNGQAKQKYITGTEPVRIKAIEDAAYDYVAVRDERMSLTESEGENQERLLALMKTNQLTKYIFGDEPDQMVVEVVATDERAKVKKFRPEKKE